MAFSYHYLLTFVCLVPWSQAFISTTTVAVAGMPKVHVPFIVLDHIAPISPGEIDIFWAKLEKNSKDLWRFIIEKNREGQIIEHFGKPFMGTNTKGKHNVKNEQFYGRVNVTIPYSDLVIHDVKSEDAGQFLCHFRNIRTGEHGKAIVQLIVYQGIIDTSSGNRTCIPDITDNSYGWTGTAFWISFTLNIVFGAIIAYKFNLCHYIKRTVQANRGGPGAINASPDEIPITDVNRNEGANDEEVIMNPQFQC